MNVFVGSAGIGFAVFLAIVMTGRCSGLPIDGFLVGVLGVGSVLRCCAVACLVAGSVLGVGYIIGFSGLVCPGQVVVNIARDAVRGVHLVVKCSV